MQFALRQLLLLHKAHLTKACIYTHAQHCCFTTLCACLLASVAWQSCKMQWSQHARQGEALITHCVAPSLLWLLKVYHEMVVLEKMHSLPSLDNTVNLQALTARPQQLH